MTTKAKKSPAPGKSAAPERLVKLTLQLRFHAGPGQTLFVTSAHPLFSGNVEKAVPLQPLNDQCSQVSLYLSAGVLQSGKIIYNYILRNLDGTLIYDWGHDKALDPANFQQDELLIIDAWNHAGYCENAFYTEPFQAVLLKSNHTPVKTAVPETATHIFKVKAPLLAQGQTLCLLGNNHALTNWNTAAPILLSRHAGEDFFSVRLNLAREKFPVAYKYGVYDVANHHFLRFEDGDNRILFDTVAPNKLTVVNDGFATLPATTWRGAGVAIPVFSLRSEKSFGVGEFADLKLLADWAKQVGLKLVQILPVNDTSATGTWADSYPYAAISAFALHPQYLNLAAAASDRNRPLLKRWEARRKKLNALPVVDYEAVIKAKLEFVKKIYPSQKAATFARPDYRRFFDENKHWLVPYAAFCYLRDKYKTADFNQWPAHRTCDPAAIAALTAPGAKTFDAVALHYFIQYHLHRQLTEATEYAHAQGIILKGDIAIGIYRYGVDAWKEPELYHMDVQAGAPPDDFAVKGQNWGFPTYNWARMKADDFAWWKQRFGQMSHYFDAFRIDHILGFFRIWSIPLHAVEGILGCFVPAIPVALGEFHSRGIGFNYDRFLKPYITDQVLWALFGDDNEWVKQNCLNPAPSVNYELKPRFATQRLVEYYFASLRDNERNRRLKLGLYDLISNVLLFEVTGSQGRQFHFRLAMTDTLSFKNLEPAIQGRLKELYIDYFYRRQDVLWTAEAMQKLPALKRETNMLVCGEDLGMVPDCVPEVMKQLGLLSLDIQRMPKDPKKEFFRPREANYLSVVTPSTHDMSTIRGWWAEENKPRIQKFYNEELGRSGAAPAVCDSGINRAIILQHLNSPAMWSIFQLQDLLGNDEHLRRANPDDERINQPANPKHYWRYRMHLTLEDLKQARAFNDALKHEIQQSGR